MRQEWGAPLWWKSTAGPASAYRRVAAPRQVGAKRGWLSGGRLDQRGGRDLSRGVLPYRL